MEDDQYLIKSVDKALTILEYIAKAGEPVSLSLLSSRLDIRKSTLFGLLRTLQKHRFVVQHGKQYVLGHRCHALSQAFLSRHRLPVRSYELLGQLANACQAVVKYGTLSVMRLAELVTANPSEPVLLDPLSPIEDSQDCNAHALARGQAILAFLSDDELAERLASIDTLPSFTPNTITDVADLRARLLEVRRQGYAVSRAEYTLDSFGIGAPVFDINQIPVAAVGLSVPIGHADPNTIAQCVNYTMQTAASITELLGGQAHAMLND